jgi:hypothetical protein
MTTYYVSQQVGNDANAGTGPGAGQAWLTLGKANTDNLLVADDIVRVGPGTYREKLDLYESGTAGHVISWIADPECLYLTSDKPGVVRWTATDSDDTQGTDSALDFASTTYVEASWFLFDGTMSTSKGAVHRTGGYDVTCKILDCQVFSLNAVTNIYAGRCLAIGKTAFSVCYPESCIGIGQTCFQGNSNGSGGNIAIGGNYGFITADYAVTWWNCLAIASVVGFYAGGITQSPGVSHCHAAYCSIGFQNLVLHADTYACCQFGSLTCTGDAVTEAAVVVLPNFDLLKRALEPALALTALLGAGDSAHAATITDILNRIRTMGTTDIGAYELATEALSWAVGDYQTNPPGIKITGIGQKIVQISAEAAKQVTVKVQAKHDSATTKPQVILRGQSIATQTATVTAGNNTWEQVSVSATPTINEVLELVLYGREASKIAYFSDIDITVT